MRREGRKGKYWGGVDDPIVVPRNAHDGDRGVLFSAHDLFGNLKMMELGRRGASRSLQRGHKQHKTRSCVLTSSSTPLTMC